MWRADGVGKICLRLQLSVTPKEIGSHSAPGSSSSIRIAARYEARAAGRGLPPFRWREEWPVGTYSLNPLRAALVAADAGRLREFSAIKERLRESTDAAIELGVTGVPTVVVGDELFWGDDQLDAAVAAVSARAR